MATSITYQGVTRLLSDRLVWSDEHAWQPVAMESDRGTLGDMQLWVRSRQGGRPITLDGVQSNAWMPRSAAQAIEEWAAIPGAQFTLTLRGVDRLVMFDHTRAPAFEARPLWDLADGEQTPDMPMRVSLKFIEI